MFFHGAMPLAAAKGKPVARGYGPRPLSDRDLAETGKQSLQRAASYAERRCCRRATGCRAVGILSTLDVGARAAGTRMGMPAIWTSTRRLLTRLRISRSKAGSLVAAMRKVCQLPRRARTSVKPARAWNPAASWIGRWARQRVFSGHLVSVTRIRTSLVFDRAMMALHDGRAMWPGGRPSTTPLPWVGNDDGGGSRLIQEFRSSPVAVRSGPCVMKSDHASPSAPS